MDPPRLSGTTHPSSEAVGVDRRSRPARRQQPAPASRSSQLPRRHRADVRPARDSRPPRSDHRGHRVREPTHGQRRRDRIQGSVDQQHREVHANVLSPLPEPAQPAPHRLHRPAQHRGDRPCPRSGGFRCQRGPYHLRQIHPPRQHEHREKDMRTTTARAPSPPRPDANQPRNTPQNPVSGPAPRRQHTTAIRTLDLTRQQSGLDPDRVRLYREHWRLRALHGPPGLGQENTGRAFACPPHRQGAAANQRPSLTGMQPKLSAHSMPSTRPQYRHLE